MPKYRRRSTARRAPYKRRGYARPKRNFMQTTVSSGITMKFTTVLTPQFQQQEPTCGFSVALLGQRNNNTANSITPCYNITSCNPDGKLQRFAADFQQFQIYGVSVKLIFANPTEPEETPVQWAMAYSPNLNIRGDIDGEILQSLSSYQTGPCNPGRSVERYFPLSYTSKKLGIDYAPVSELVSPNGAFNTIGFESITPSTPTQVNAIDLYGGQLPAFTGPSLNVRVYRSGVGVGNYEQTDGCRCQLTYYVRFRGIQARSDLV